MKITSSFYIVFQVLKELHLKFVRYSHQIFYFFLFLLTFTSADITFSQFFKTLFSIITKEDFRHEFSFLTDSLNLSPLPQPP